MFDRYVDFFAGWLDIFEQQGTSQWNVSPFHVFASRPCFLLPPLFSTFIFRGKIVTDWQEALIVLDTFRFRFLSRRSSVIRPPSIDHRCTRLNSSYASLNFPLDSLPRKYVSLFSFSKFSRAIEEANSGKILKKYSLRIEVRIRLRIRLKQIPLSLSLKTSRFFLALIFRLIELARRKINRVPSFHGRASGYLKHRW